VFLWSNPNGINLEVGKRGGGRGRDERASCVAQLHLFQNILADYGGVVPGRQDVRIFVGGPWTLKTNSKPLRETSKEIFNAVVVRMIVQVRGKLRDINGNGRGQL